MQHGLESRKTGLRDRRHIWQQAEARRACDRERTQIAGFDIALAGGKTPNATGM
jgi:hypothetical protein